MVLKAAEVGKIYLAEAPENRYDYTLPYSFHTQTINNRKQRQSQKLPFHDFLLDKKQDLNKTGFKAMVQDGTNSRFN